MLFLPDFPDTEAQDIPPLTSAFPHMQLDQRFHQCILHITRGSWT